MSNTQQTGNVANMAERNREILAMPNVRVFYQKRGRAKFISHLDVTRCMQRALKRAEIVPAGACLPVAGLAPGQPVLLQGAGADARCRVEKIIPHKEDTHEATQEL